MTRSVLCTAAAVAAADQAVKAIIRQFPEGAVLLRLEPFLEITHCVNTGAAFSMLSGRTALLSVVSALLLAAVSVIIWRSMCLTRAGYLAFACLLGGGIGNLIDRMLLGGVTDYIRLLLFRFPVFNLADIAITMSIAVLMLLLLRGRREENEHHG